MNNPTIAVIGTGIMGAPMAGRLAEAGFKVTAWNRTSDKASVLQARGVVTADNAVDAVDGADVVICMLSSGPVCEKVLMGDDGVIAAMKPGSILLVMSSIPVETAIALANAASDRGVACLDAPVSGGEKGARDGTLAIMAGGDAAVVDRLRPVFACLGRVMRAAVQKSATVAAE
ncbi:NAD(P)-dependent oxidoreductase [Pararhizobium antarcticum]|uniref:NAD(P)-dependent oxidoreductase n=1 Tax=Pararhizobium antarcticum TaxID=1798805 RepID=UPI0009FA38EC